MTWSSSTCCSPTSTAGRSSAPCARRGSRQWVGRLAAAVREEDKRHLLTVGLVDWSLDRSRLTSGFVPSKVAGDLDFISVHLYPKAGKAKDALDTLAGFAVGKPVLVEETFPLARSPKELEEFIEVSG
jgi:hypothetical protein